MSKSLYKLRMTPWYFEKGRTAVCVQIGSSTLASLWTDGRARGKSSTSYELVPIILDDNRYARGGFRRALRPSHKGS
jgi:hypothetical protein